MTESSRNSSAARATVAATATAATATAAATKAAATDQDSEDFFCCCSSSSITLRRQRLADEVDEMKERLNFSFQTKCFTKTGSKKGGKLFRTKRQKMLPFFSLFRTLRAASDAPPAAANRRKESSEGESARSHSCNSSSRNSNRFFVVLKRLDRKEVPTQSS